MVHPVRLARWALLSIFLGCVPQVAPEPAEDLAGLTLPLRPAGAVRLLVEGRVGSRPAEVALEVSQPLTLVNAGCFEQVPRSSTVVRYPAPEGGTEEASEIELGNARLGNRRLGPIRAGLVDGERCGVTLGSDVLSKYALQVDPETRMVRLLPSRARQVYLDEATSPEAQASGFEYHLVDVVQDPATDWPLLAARAKQEGDALTGAFILSTAAAQSVVMGSAAAEAGLELGPPMLRELDLPRELQLPRALGGTTFSVDRLEFAPGFGLAQVGLQAEGEWKNKGAVGLLAGDVWGRFHATIDPAAGVLALRRPRLLTSGDRQRCAKEGGGAPSEEACFVLHERDLPGPGMSWAMTVWRHLPRGGRLYLDAVDEAGKSLDGACRLGMSFGPNDRGATAAHKIPWPGLERALPDCAAQLQAAAKVRFALWEEGPLDECPGTCAFVQDVVRERVSCECQGGTGGNLGAAERQFLERYKDLIRQRKSAPREPAVPDEPEDPGAE